MGTGRRDRHGSAPWIIGRLPESRWEDFRTLRLKALQQDSKAFGSSYEEEVTYGKETWIGRIESVIFALIDDRPVGMISIIKRNRIKTGHAADIFGMYVAPDYRGKGIGDDLVKNAISVASKFDGVIKVVLSVNPKQEAALNLYRKNGFEVAGEFKKELLVDGEYYDEFVMERFL